MAKQLSELIRIAGISILITFLWAASIAFTYWDTHRQRLPEAKCLLWLIVVVALPLLGFVVYISSKALSLFISLGRSAIRSNHKRETLLKSPLPGKNPLPTRHASSIFMPKVIESDGVNTAFGAEDVSTKYMLSVTSGTDMGNQFIIQHLPATIGRGSQVSIRLDGDLAVSREHAEIYLQAGDLRIRDLKSTHGTSVNGVHIEDQSLANGDRIQIGITTLELNLVR